MVDEPRSFAPDTAAANQTRQQGGGVGQREMDAQRDPDRAADPTTPQPPAPAGEDDGATAGRDRGRFPERNAAGLDDVRGDLGAGTPPGVDIHDTEEPDNPEADWGRPATGAAYSATNTNRGDDPTRELQGSKTRARTKEINSGGL